MRSLFYTSAVILALWAGEAPLFAQQTVLRNGPEVLLKRHPELESRYLAAQVGKAFADELRTTTPRTLSSKEYLRSFDLGAATAYREFIYDGSKGAAPDRAAILTQPPLAGGLIDNLLFARNKELLTERTVAGYRIIGGGEAGPGDFPDCVAVIGQQTQNCTGTLIAPKLVLTAAHCAQLGGPRRIFVGEKVGQNNGRYYDVKTPYHFPPANADGTKPDIMVLELTEPVEGVVPMPVLKNQAPAAFPSQNDPEGFRLLRVAGFGHSNAAGNEGKGIKRFADVPVAGGSAEQLGYKPPGEFTAGLEGLDIDTCKGDSGGPAYVYVIAEDRWYLIGCTSRSTLHATQTCGDGGIYVRMDTYRPWLEQVAVATGQILP